jgi:putative nucleotidyltransferase with HDIG domain
MEARRICRVDLKYAAMAVDTESMGRHLPWRGATRTPFLRFVGGSAAIVAVGGFILSWRLPELPRSRAATRTGDLEAYAEVLTGVWLATVVLATTVWVSFARRTTRSQDLVETTRELEQSLLDTIETLNAAVEARDPYTAGHSQRVRRVSLAVGRAMNLPVDRLSALGTAALFHDIGKIGMPDSILTKAAHLTRDEQALMREHVTRGSEIVAKFPQFRNAIPAIRHHHERWDGVGYPDGLAGEEIPLEAAIVGLADAWDAMTTNRPYAPAQSLHDALEQIRAGRAKQFSPEVVDAFWEVARKRPADVLPSEEPGTQVAVV